MIKAVIFDMDGVLINSQPLHFEADKDCLKEIGVKADSDFVESLAGTTTPNRFELFQKKYHYLEKNEVLIKRREELIVTLFENRPIEKIEGAVNLVKQCSQKGILTGVASSSSYKLIDIVLKKLSIENYFSVVLSGEELKRGKPFPDIFLKTAEKLSVLAKECIVIEDSAAGVTAAVNAHMKVIGYQNPTSGAQNLNGASLVIKKFDEISVEKIINLK